MNKSIRMALFLSIIVGGAQLFVPTLNAQSTDKHDKNAGLNDQYDWGYIGFGRDDSKYNCQGLAENNVELWRSEELCTQALDNYPLLFKCWMLVAPEDKNLNTNHCIAPLIKNYLSWFIDINDSVDIIYRLKSAKSENTLKYSNHDIIQWIRGDILVSLPDNDAIDNELLRYEENVSSITGVESFMSLKYREKHARIIFELLNKYGYSEMALAVQRGIDARVPEGLSAPPKRTMELDEIIAKYSPKKEEDGAENLSTETEKKSRQIPEANLKTTTPPATSEDNPPNPEKELDKAALHKKPGCSGGADASMIGFLLASVMSGGVLVWQRRKKGWPRPGSE